MVQDLEQEGYHVVVFNFEAAAVGAPHRRSRVFLVANACGEGLQREQFGRKHREEPGGRQERIYGTAAECGEDVAHTVRMGLKRFGHPFEEGCNGNQEHFAVTKGCYVCYASTSGLQNRTEGKMERWKDPNRSQNLNDQIGGQLNPTWVEWLMGFPIGWTDCDASEMQSCRSSFSQFSEP